MYAQSSHISPVSIVIVDDDEITLECYSRLLRGLNCSLLSYANPLDSLTALIRQQPQLLLVDMNMPCMSGVELLTELFALTKPNDCRIHLCSSVLPSPEICRWAGVMGVDAICKDRVMDKAWLRNTVQQCQ